MYVSCRRSKSFSSVSRRCRSNSASAPPHRRGRCVRNSDQCMCSFQCEHINTATALPTSSVSGIGAEARLRMLAKDGFFCGPSLLFLRCAGEAFPRWRRCCDSSSIDAWNTMWPCCFFFVAAAEKIPRVGKLAYDVAPKKTDRATVQAKTRKREKEK